MDSLVAGGPEPSAYRELFANRNYRLWFLSSLGSSLGDWTGFFALGALVTSLYSPGSRAALFGLGGVMMARLLPSLVMGPVAGVLADRYDRKRLIIFTDVARGALYVGIAFSGEVLTMFTLTFVVECLSLLFMSAKDASLPAVVPRRHLTQANQLNLLVTYGTLPLGALLATAMIPVAGVLQQAAGLQVQATVLALLANALSFWWGGLMFARMSLPRGGRPSDGESPGLLAELREGIQFIRDFPLIRALIQGVVGVFFGAGIVVALGPEFVRGELGRPASDWFTLATFVGSGLVIGILLVPLLLRGGEHRKERLFPIAMATTGGIGAVIATLPSFQLTLAFGLVLGATAGMSFVTGYTLLHEHTEDTTRARTFAAFYTTTRIALFSALGLGPLVAATIGRFTIILGSARFSTSGLRLTLLAGGLVALLSSYRSGRAIDRSLKARPGRPVRLPTAAGGQSAPGRPGVFITFEGVEGSGKSTQVRALAAQLQAEGRTVVVTREPGGPPVAERIRGVLLDPALEGMHPRTEALLYAAARAEHVHRLIQPALADGAVVLCDRYLHSSLAYQGRGRNLGEADVAEINRWGIAGLLPDAVVLLDLDAETGLRRVAERSRRSRSGGSAHRGRRVAARGVEDDDGTLALPLDRIEQEPLEFHRCVAAAFREMAARDRGRFVVVEADEEAHTISRQIRKALHPWLPLPDDQPAGAGSGPAQDVAP